MIRYIIAGVVGIFGIGVYVLAQEVGRYCEELNPFQGLPVHEDCEICYGQFGDCKDCIGNWVCETHDDDFGDVVIKDIKTYKCSNCGYTPSNRNTNFCPNCGDPKTEEALKILEVRNERNE